MYFSYLHHTQSRTFHMRSLSMKTHWHVIHWSVSLDSIINFIRCNLGTLPTGHDVFPGPCGLPCPFMGRRSRWWQCRFLEASDAMGFLQCAVNSLRLKTGLQTCEVGERRKYSRYGCWEKPPPFRTMEQNALHTFSKMLYELNI